MKFVIAQSPKSGGWRHYFCGWVGAGTWIREGIHEIPVFLPARDQAVVLDEITAHRLVDRFDARYRKTVRHIIEELT